MLHPRFIALTGTHDEVRVACRAYRVYFTKPTPEEIARGDYLLDHSIISYLVSGKQLLGRAAWRCARTDLGGVRNLGSWTVDLPFWAGRSGWRVCRLLWQVALSRRNA